MTWLILVLAYLLGSIPFAKLASQWIAGKDIRDLGDGNMGAKNTFHSVGRLAGATVAAADVAKGALAVLIARWLHAPEAIVLLAGAFAVLGHDFPLFAGFRGGQGMATMLGAFAVLFPRETVITVFLFALLYALSRNWDLSWAGAFVVFVFLVWRVNELARLVFYPLVLLPTIGARKLMQRRARLRSGP